MALGDMLSPSFEHFLRQIELLRARFLPAHFDPTGSYVDEAEVELGIAAFVVLSHAEIESYLEVRVIELAATASKLAKRRVATIPGTALIAFNDSLGRSAPSTLEAPQGTQKKEWPCLIDYSEKVVRAASMFIAGVKKSNHGIKEENVLGLLLPIGFSHTDLDPKLLADLSSFGSLRGAMAHQSLSDSAVRQGYDPKDLYERVRALATQLQALDSLLSSLMENARPKSSLKRFKVDMHRLRLRLHRS